MVFIVLVETDLGTQVGNVYADEAEALIEATEKGGRVVARKLEG